MCSANEHIGSSIPLSSHHILHVNVDVEAQEALILDLAVLRDHEHVLLRDQVIDAIGDLLCHLSRTFDTCACAFLDDDLFEHDVNDLGLLDRFLAVTLELLKVEHDQFRDLFVLLVCDLYFLLSWLCLLLNPTLRFSLSLHPLPYR